MGPTLPSPPLPRRPDTGTIRDRLDSQQRQISDLRAKVDVLTAELHFALRRLGIDPDDFDFPGGTL